jgi:DNA-directed RNA polymerase specialized sigma24 family protein
MEESDGAVIADSLKTPGAFGAIFDRHGSTLLRFLARRVDPAEAEDLLGDVFRIAFERRSTFERGRASARPWLYGIAANVVAKHHRSEARRFVRR